MLKYSDKYNPANEQQVAAIEKTIGAAIPDDYRHFLLTDGGGYWVEPCNFNVPGEGDDVVKVLFGFSEDRYNLAKEVAKTHTYPSGFLPVGEDPFGNRLLIGITPATYGGVFWRDHELTPNGEEQSPILVAESFKTFVESLTGKQI